MSEWINISRLQGFMNEWIPLIFRNNERMNELVNEWLNGLILRSETGPCFGFFSPPLHSRYPGSICWIGFNQNIYFSVQHEKVFLMYVPYVHVPYVRWNVKIHLNNTLLRDDFWRTTLVCLEVRDAPGYGVRRFPAFRVKKDLTYLLGIVFTC